MEKEPEKHTDTDEKEDSDHTTYHFFDNLELRAILLEVHRQNSNDDPNAASSDDESEIEYEEEFDQIEDKNGKLVVSPH